MKKLTFLLLIFSMTFFSCSIDEELPSLPEDTLQNLSASALNEGCDIVIVEDFDDFGKIHVYNDNDYIYVTFSANEGLALENAKLHMEDDYEDFPTVGNGNLPPGQMKINEGFEPAVEYHNFNFPIEEYSTEDGTIVIAAKADFTDGFNTYSSWAGDISGAKGNWYYFEYYIQQCPVTDPCDLLADNYSTTVTYSYVDNNVNDVGEIYAFLLEELGGNEEILSGGSFSKTRTELLREVNNWYNNTEDQSVTISVTYTVSQDDCIDSTLLQLTITR